MAGIYIHIPFCKQACHYCNFHFSTSLRQKNELVDALLKEITIRADYLGAGKINTIYFGGGTPSLLPPGDLARMLDTIRQTFQVDPNAELTLEANPDDLDGSRLSEWRAMGVNRLSIGIQSFFDEDLQWMNRAHSAMQSRSAIDLVRQAGFDNFSIDLIYGFPLLTDEKWKSNVDTAIALGIPHLSCYAMTVEPRTPLNKMIAVHSSPPMDTDQQGAQFLSLMDWLTVPGYEHYEISNFALPGLRSRHNSSYWSAGDAEGWTTYLGIGPSAHSFDSKSRQWNISNNQQYISSIQNGLVPYEKEVLTEVQQLNEYIMTSLRTMEGLKLSRAGKIHLEHLEKKSREHINNGLMVREDDFLRLTKKGKLLADGIAASLFV